MQKQLALCRSGKLVDARFNPPYIALPRALVDEYGFPHKANKSGPTNFSKNRYSTHHIIEFPKNWTPDAVLLEGMFMIQTTPILGIVDYCQLLANWFVLPHFKNGVKQVHVIFDCPNTNNKSPKEIERNKRDKEHKVTSHHTHANITQSGEIPSNWRDDIINCHECKKNLCHFLGMDMLQTVQTSLQEGQQFFTSGGFYGTLFNKCMLTTNSSTEIIESLQSNSEETDLRIWLHCKYAYGTKKLVYSPDTDIYHIGLPLIDNSCDI